MFRPGDRVDVAVSGGADSVALLRALHAVAAERGVVLRAAHVHHGLRGEEADADADFVRELAASLAVPLDETRVDTQARIAETGESVEQAARELRYAFFRELLAGGTVDVIATAHTLNDQAETVLLKLLRGAWTEGLGGISPSVAEVRGRIVRPLLQSTRDEVEAYLNALQQPWRQDSSNASPEYTRNRVRHELVPLLQTFNPNVAEQLARVAQVARDEESCWQAELHRLLPGLLLPGKPVRGGGRSVSSADAGHALTLDLAKLAVLPVAVQRRVLRETALRLNFRLEFDSVDALLRLLADKAGSRVVVGQGLLAERSARELRLTSSAPGKREDIPSPVEISVPGSADAPEFGLRVEASACTRPHSAPSGPVVLRVWRPGDRVRLKFTLSDAKVKEVLQRMKIPPEQKACWPVIVWQGTVLWMQGCEVQPPADAPQLKISLLCSAANLNIP